MSLWSKLKGLLAKGRAVVAGSLPPPSADAYFLNSKNFTSVQSSNVKSVGYFRDLRRGGGAGVLGIRFRNGSCYLYPGQSYSAFTDMLSATSKGQWVHQRLIKTGAAYRRLI